MINNPVKTLLKNSVWIALLTTLTACQVFQETPSASAVLQSKSGSNLNGSVSFSQSGMKVLVTGTFSGLKPNAEHGIHIHEKGDCSSLDAMSAGGHFNPANAKHGNCLLYTSPSPRD